ncbi:TetR/AcrR family transcriptional regulator [Rhodobacteraceae bacterium]|nr:TetR/AcrR family transcriptional regulator [Paracoccaceae bacterium]
MSEIQKLLNLKAPKAQIRAENERVILDAAETIFAQHGFRGSTMQMIADQADLPKANVHYYFASKKELYRRVVEQIFGIWLQAADSFEQSDNPAEALRKYIEQKMEISRLRKNGSKVWANEVMHGAPIIQDFLETQLTEWTDGRIEMIQKWIEDKKIRPINPRWVLYMIWATTQHYADFTHQVETLNAAEPLSKEQWDDATETIFQIIWAGLAPKSGT